MSRGFDNLLGSELTGTPVVTTYPFTMACWANLNDIAGNNTLMTLSDGTTSNAFRLSASGDVAGDPIKFRATVAGASSDANSSAGYSANTWFHAAAVGASATQRRVLLNGANGVDNTTSRNPGGINNIDIGCDGAGTQNASGFIAEAAIWNVALTDAELLMLFTTEISPLMYRATDLQHYWPLYGVDSPEIDKMGGGNLTVTGTTKEVHPPMRYPSLVTVGVPPIVVGGVVIPVLMYDYRRRRVH